MKEKGIEHIILLKGDSKAVAEAIGNKLGIDKIFSELLPQDKVEKSEEIMAHKTKKDKVAFVGDGNNDTPVLLVQILGLRWIV